MRGVGPRALGLMRSSPIGLRMMASEAREEYDAVIIGGGILSNPFNASGISFAFQ
jgi:hypothetical protein